MKIIHIASHYPLLLFVLLFVHHTSARILPILPQTGPNRGIPPTRHGTNNTATNDLTIDQNIATLLRTLSSHTLPIYLNQAKPLNIRLTAGPGDKPDTRRRSDKISDFRSISIDFKGGDIGPATPVEQQYFRIHNLFPTDWDQWGPPIAYNPHPPLIYLEDRIPLIWRRIQELMSIEEAYSLARGAGYSGAIDRVWLMQMDTRPLQYCFQGFWPGLYSKTVVVEVETKIVKRVSYVCYLELPGTTA
ncbi:MAG: hypothetical protein Q9224_004161 [Gallowayella concinna]